MGEHTDKIRGRVKQAIGALTGNHDLKREGERQERKGEVKGHIDDAVDKAKDTADDVKDKIVKAVDKGIGRRQRAEGRGAACSAPGLSWPRLAPASS